MRPAQVAGVPSDVPRVAAQAAGVRADDAAHGATRIGARTVRPSPCLVLPRVMDGRPSRRAWAHPSRAAPLVLRAPEAAVTAPTGVVAIQGPAAWVQEGPRGAPGLLAPVLAPRRVRAPSSAKATTVALGARLMDGTQPATGASQAVPARPHFLPFFCVPTSCELRPR